MRTVTPRADHVVVVGAGFAGLAAALHLLGRGREVTIVEREQVPGGRAGRLDLHGYRVDTGPTVLTMPEIINATFAAVDGELSDYVDLMPVSPAYHASFADGSGLDVHTDPEVMEDSIRRFAGAAEAEGYRRLRVWLRRLYQAEFDRFIAANFDSPLSVVTPALARVAALGAFSGLDRAIGRFLRDERLRRVFSFQSLYVGQAPQRALALYAVIAYMDTIAGVFFPRGGVRALPDGLAAAATRAGALIEYGTTVTALERSGSRVRAVHTADDRRIACDAVVLTSELPTSYALLGRTPRRMTRLRAAPSAAVLHFGCRRTYPLVAHHNLVFGKAWGSTFRELSEGRLMRDPSLLVTRPTATDPALAPPGHDLISVLAPTPNLHTAPIDWREHAAAYTDELLSAVRDRLLPGLGVEVEWTRLMTPDDWMRQGMLAGSPFSLAHTLTQTGPFRPGNFPRGTDNVVLAGSSTVPGVGVPIALLSGRLAADRITGPWSARVRERVP